MKQPRRAHVREHIEKIKQEKPEMDDFEEEKTLVQRKNTLKSSISLQIF